MYSYVDRLRAVMLYIKLGKRVPQHLDGSTIALRREHSIGLLI